MRRGSVLFEAVLAVVLGAALLVPAASLLGQVLQSAAKVAAPGLDAFETVLAKTAASAPPPGVVVDPLGTGVPDSVSLTWRTAYRGGAERRVVFRLEGSEVVLDDGETARVVASGVRGLVFSLERGVLRVSASGDGWRWERGFVLLGGG